MSSTVVSSGRNQRFPLSRILVAGLVAAVAAAAANVIVFFIASALGAMPQTYLVPAAGQPIGIMQVVSSTVIGAVGATIVFAIIARFARQPIRLFRIVSVVALILSFGTFLGLSGAPVSLVMTLALMHIVAAVVIVGVLTTMARTR
jgi:hypothetical protein